MTEDQLRRSTSMNIDEPDAATSMNSDVTTERDSPDDPANFRDRERAALADRIAGDASTTAADTSADIGTTYPSETVEGPWTPEQEDRPYFPPTDPVLKPNPSSDQGLDILGGLEPTAMDDVGLTGGQETGPMPGDDAIKAAVVRELREDAMTTDLTLRVEVRDGEVTLRGSVADLDDSDAAIEVASRVEGVANVEDQIEVEGLGLPAERQGGASNR